MALTLSDVAAFAELATTAPWKLEKSFDSVHATTDEDGREVLIYDYHIEAGETLVAQRLTQEDGEFILACVEYVRRRLSPC